jgi:hypothetical protein
LAGGVSCCRWGGVISTLCRCYLFREWFVFYFFWYFTHVIIYLQDEQKFLLHEFMHEEFPMMKRSRRFTALWCVTGVLGVASVGLAAGAEGIVTVALTLLVCEFVGAAARELRGEQEPTLMMLRVGLLLSLLCAAMLLDAATGRTGVFPILGGALGLVFSFLPRRRMKPSGSLTAVARLPIAANASIMGAKYHAPVRTQPCMSSYRRGKGRGTFNAPQRSVSMPVTMASR